MHLCPPPLPAQVRSALAEARSSLMAVLPAVAAESYARAYPLAAKLHMLAEMGDAFALMARVSCLFFTGRWGF